MGPTLKSHWSPETTGVSQKFSQGGGCCGCETGADGQDGVEAGWKTAR